MPNSLPVGNLQPTILIETNNEPEVSSFLYNENKENNNAEDEINVSQAITQASNEISKNIQIIDESDFENNEVPNIKYVRNNGLDYNFLIAERKKHDAYNSRPILRQLKTLNTRNSDNENSIQPNIASQMVSHFANNNSREQNFVSQRENRWKSSHQSMAESLANHNNKKNQQLNSGKRNLIPYIPNIENTNINDDFPLIQNHFVLCIYVLALYYELYGNHSFNTKPVTKIDDISKITLKIFLPVSSNLFSQYTPEECNIVTHRNLSNIIFHLLTNDVIINEQSLILSNVAKNYYNYFKRNDVISLILENNS
ncbi:hypothetical protein Glove_189g28 [Diversispora epigaea]|uniref:Uncharacterized protein n=1 Tax=Diversispora epigaea TaxID=1348612 RepID=A0A397IV57_9GLOM|nr:hypothetical protein Glove_189g28 [Diversispora epigaea]